MDHVWHPTERKLHRVKRASFAEGCAWGFGLATLLFACYLLATNPPCELNPKAFLGGTIADCAAAPLVGEPPKGE